MRWHTYPLRFVHSLAQFMVSCSVCWTPYCSRFLFVSDMNRNRVSQVICQKPCCIPGSSHEKVQPDGKKELILSYLDKLICFLLILHKKAVSSASDAEDFTPGKNIVQYWFTFNYVSLLKILNKLITFYAD